MSKILSITGVATAKADDITNSSGTLIIGCTDNHTALTTERITISYEKQGGGKEYIANDVPLRDLLYLALHQSGECFLNPHTAKGFKTLAIIELGVEAGVLLNAADKLVITLKGLNPAKTYEIYNTEEQNNTRAVFMYDTHIVAVADKKTVIDVSDKASVCVDLTATISEIGLTANGKETRFLPFEVEQLAKQGYEFVQPAIGGNNATYPEGTAVIDLIGIDYLTVYKDGTQAVNMTFMWDSELPAGTTARVIGGVKPIPVAAVTGSLAAISRSNFKL